MSEQKRMEMTNNMKPIVSLCLPTNGIIEWVFPVLDSIYGQGVDTALFEVIVTNNGDSEEFHKLMLEYARTKENLIYKKNKAYMFHNQLEALKLGSGDYLKLVNHRALFVEDSLKKMIQLINHYREEKPVIYFSNGVIKNDYEFTNFDDFVNQLGIFASWTTGVGIWKSAYDELPNDIKIDRISPHSCILFSDRKNDKYVINDFLFSKEIENDHSKKGSYDLFKAFGVEELTVIQNLYIDGDITAFTLKKVKKDYKKFVKGLYFDFVIRKKPCSYDLSGFNDAMGIYFSKSSIVIGGYLIGFERIFEKIIGRNN